MAIKSANLFIIDPQQDFCKPGAQPIFDANWHITNADVASGALFVPGADRDMVRLAKMIADNQKRIKRIIVTLDSHNPIHIAHPVFVVDSNGNHPQPFTLITNADVKAGKWRGKNPEFTKILLDYTEKLEATGKLVLCVWTPHCLIGTPGHNVYAPLATELQNWVNFKGKNVDYFTKGSNPFTEHYGAAKAEVERDDDITTKMNAHLVQLLLNTGDEDIVIAGEALSHCVATTIRQVATEFAKHSPDLIKKFVLLTDACSNVNGFEQLGNDFITEMTNKGLRVSTTDAYFA